MIQPFKLYLSYCLVQGLKGTGCESGIELVKSRVTLKLHKKAF